MNLSRWYAELRRRRVLRALFAYGVASFAVLQVIEPVMHGLRLPDVVLSVVVVLLGLGFPVTILLAWAFDLKPTGIERTRPAAAVQPGPDWPVAGSTGSRAAVIIALVALGLAIAAPGVTWFFVFRSRGSAEEISDPLKPGPSVAVLPFADLSPAKDQSYLADGVAEDILGALAQVEGLRVPGRSSSFWFRGKNARLAEIGRDLGVRTVLEGSVRRDGNRIRVAAQLVDVGNGYQLWSRTFDRDLDDIFKVQEEIAQAVATSLEVQLLTGPPPARGRKPRIEAYEQYLLGRQLRGTGTRASILAARDALERAVALDPGFAAAHAALAEAHGNVAGLLADSPDEVTAAAMLEVASAERAIGLDPSLPDGWLARAAHRVSYAWDWKGALEDAQRAKNLGRRLPSTGLARALASTGRTTDAVAVLRKVVEGDPLSSSAWNWLGWMLAVVGDGAGAEAAARRALQIAPDSAESGSILGLALLEQGRLEESREVYVGNPFPFFRLEGLAIVSHAMGRRDESQTALDELVRTEASNAAFQIAGVHAFRGEADRAFEWLDRARAQHDEGLEHLLTDPLLASIRGDSRWKPFLRKMNFPTD